MATLMGSWAVPTGADVTTCAGRSVWTQAAKMSGKMLAATINLIAGEGLRIHFVTVTTSESVGLHPTRSQPSGLPPNIIGCSAMIATVSSAPAPIAAHGMSALVHGTRPLRSAANGTKDVFATNSR